MGMDVNAVVNDLVQAVTPTALNESAVRVEGRDSTVAASTKSERDNSYTSEQVEVAVNQIQEFTQTLAQNLKFSIDEDTGKTVVKIVDIQTQEIIRQIPSEEAISIARTLGKIQGVLFNGQA